MAFAKSGGYVQILFRDVFADTLRFILENTLLEEDNKGELCSLRHEVILALLENVDNLASTSPVLKALKENDPVASSVGSRLLSRIELQQIELVRSASVSSQRLFSNEAVAVTARGRKAAIAKNAEKTMCAEFKISRSSKTHPCEGCSSGSLVRSNATAAGMSWDMVGWSVFHTAVRASTQLARSAGLSQWCEECCA
jgi:hypothetical protein